MTVFPFLPVFMFASSFGTTILVTSSVARSLNTLPLRTRVSLPLMVTVAIRFSLRVHKNKHVAAMNGSGFLGGNLHERRNAVVAVSHVLLRDWLAIGVIAVVGDVVDEDLLIAESLGAVPCARRQIPVRDELLVDLVVGVFQA